MSEQESNRIRRIVGWGIIGLIAVMGLSIALSILLPGGQQVSSITPSSSRFILAD